MRNIVDMNSNNKKRSASDDNNSLGDHEDDSDKDRKNIHTPKRKDDWNYRGWFRRFNCYLCDVSITRCQLSLCDRCQKYVCQKHAHVNTNDNERGICSSCEAIDSIETPHLELTTSYGEEVSMFTFLSKSVVSVGVAIIEDIAKNYISCEKTLEMASNVYSESSSGRSMRPTKSILNDLKEELAPIVSFDYTLAAHVQKFAKGSRRWLFAECGLWLRNESACQRVFWLTSGPGMGKTAFASCLCQHLRHSKVLLGGVFFRYGDEARTNPRVMIRNLAYQISEHIPSLAPVILERSKSMGVQIDPNIPVGWLFQHLICDPLCLLTQKQTVLFTDEKCSIPSMVLLFDALDEASAALQAELLGTLQTKLSKLPDWVKVFVTSRREENIVKALSGYEKVEILESDERHLADLELFVREMLLSTGVPMSDVQCNDLVSVALSKSESRFVYAAMLSEKLSVEFGSCRVQLTTADISHLSCVLQEMPYGLGGVFREYLERIKSSNEQFYDQFCLPALHLLAIQYRPMSRGELMYFLQISEEDMECLVEMLHALFSLQESETPGIYRFVAFHKTVHEWLQTPKNGVCYMSKANRHILFRSCCCGRLDANACGDGNRGSCDSGSCASANANISNCFHDALFRFPVHDNATNSYIFEFMLPHLRECSGSESLIMRVLLNLSWIQSTLRHRGCGAVLTELEQWATDEAMHPTGTTLRAANRAAVKQLWRCLFLSSSGLRGDGCQDIETELCTQLLGRMMNVTPLMSEPAGLMAGLLDACRVYLDAHGGLQLCTASLESPGASSRVRLSVGLDTISIIVLNAPYILVFRTGHSPKIWNYAINAPETVQWHDNIAQSVWMDDAKDVREIPGDHGCLVDTVLKSGRVALIPLRVVVWYKHGEIKLWNLITGECEGVCMVTEQGKAWDLEILVAGNHPRVIVWWPLQNKYLGIWNLSTGEKEFNFDYEIKGACVVSPNGIVCIRRFSGREDNARIQLELLDSSTYHCLGVYMSCEFYICPLCSLDNGRMVCGIYNEFALISGADIFDCSSGSTILLERRIRWKDAWNSHFSITNILELPDGRLAMVTHDNYLGMKIYLRVWNSFRGTEVEHEQAAVALSMVTKSKMWLLPDSRVAIKGAKGTIEIINLSSVEVAEISKRLQLQRQGQTNQETDDHGWAHAASISAVCLLSSAQSHDGVARVITGATDGTICCWLRTTGAFDKRLIDTGPRTATNMPHEQLLVGLSALDRGQLAVWGCGKIKIFDVDAGICVKKLEVKIGFPGVFKLLPLRSAGSVLVQGHYFSRIYNGGCIPMPQWFLWVFSAQETVSCLTHICNPSVQDLGDFQSAHVHDGHIVTCAVDNPDMPNSVVVRATHLDSGAVYIVPGTEGRVNTGKIMCSVCDRYLLLSMQVAMGSNSPRNAVLVVDSSAGPGAWRLCGTLPEVPLIEKMTGVGTDYVVISFNTDNGAPLSVYSVVSGDCLCSIQSYKDLTLLLGVMCDDDSVVWDAGPNTERKFHCHLDAPATQIMLLKEHMVLGDHSGGVHMIKRSLQQSSMDVCA